MLFAAAYYYVVTVFFGISLLVPILGHNCIEGQAVCYKKIASKDQAKVDEHRLCLYSTMLHTHDV